MEVVYMMTNTKNNKKYIGSSINYEERIKDHLRSLKGNYHENKRIQEDYNKYGKESLKFKILYKVEDGESEKRFRLERETIEYYKTYETGYNLSYDGRGKYIITEETREKYRRNSAGKNNPMYGKKHTEKTKRLISEKASKRVGELNHFYGKSHTKETRRKLSEMGRERHSKGLINPSNRRKVHVEGVEYKSVRYCAKVLGVVPNTVINRIRSDKFPDYYYVDNEQMPNDYAERQ